MSLGTPHEDLREAYLLAWWIEWPQDDDYLDALFLEAEMLNLSDDAERRRFVLRRMRETHPGIMIDEGPDPPEP